MCVFACLLACLLVLKQMSVCESVSKRMNEQTKWTSECASAYDVYFAHHLKSKRDWIVLIKNKIYGIHDSRIPFIEMHLVKLDASGASIPCASSLHSICLLFFFWFYIHVNVCVCVWFRRKIFIFLSRWTNPRAGAFLFIRSIAHTHTRTHTLAVLLYL